MHADRRSPRPDRTPQQVLVQLCQHFSHKGRFLGHRRPAFITPDLMMVRWSEDHGIVSFGWGQCTLHAGSGTLMLRAEADSEESLQRVQDVVARHLGRFGRRDHLTASRMITHPCGGAPRDQSAQPQPTR